MGAKKLDEKKGSGGSEAEPTCGPASSVENVVKHVTTGCSVEFGRDSKGQPKWTLKAACERPDMGDVVTELLALDSRLREETSRG